MKKYITSISLILFSMVALSQKLNLPAFDNTGIPTTLKEVRDSATTSSVTYSITDIHKVSPREYIDLSTNVSFSMFYEYLDINLPAVKEEFNLTLNVEIFGESKSSGSTSISKMVSLSINQLKDLDKEVYNFNKNNLIPNDLFFVDSVVYTIDTSELAGFADNLLAVINLQVNVEYWRYSTEAFNNIEPKFYKANATTGNNLKENEAIIKWDESTLTPCYYEIEWVHVYSENPQPTDNIDVSFLENTHRIQTDKNFFPVNMMYNTGYLVARGRIVRPILNSDSSALTNKVYYSPWTEEDIVSNKSAADQNVLIIDHLIDTTTFKTNWQYQASHSANSKKKELLTIYDGSSRSRQSITFLNNFNQTTSLNEEESNDAQSTLIAKEDYYDFNGNPIISILPTPIKDANNFGYQKSTNLTELKNKLSKNDYDRIGVNEIVRLDSSEKGAARYYSNQNQYLGLDSFANYIPKADNYAYTFQEHMKDGSGRLKVSYSPGKEKRLNSTKNTRYAYSKPTGIELNQLFGTNTGKASFYKKNISIDPNGVISNAYVDNNGRTVATSISGLANSSSNMVNLYANNKVFTENLLNTGAERFLAQNGTYELSYPIFSPTTSLFTFDYGFNIDSYVSCTNVNICFDCKYELVFQLLDENNKLVLEAKDSLVNFQENDCLSDIYVLDKITYFDTASYGATITQNNEIEITLLAQTQYTLVKKLKFLNDHLDNYATTYIASDCVEKTEDDFLQVELNNADFESCFTFYPEDEFYISDRPYNHCLDILKELRSDFQYPYGAFASGAIAGDLVPEWFYGSLTKVFGCNNLTMDYTEREFTALFNLEMGLSKSPSFSDFEERFIDFLVYFHPTYCQYTTCLKYYTEESLTYDQILWRSDSIEDFVRIMKEEGRFSGTDSVYFDNDKNIVLSASQQIIELYEFDNTMKGILDTSLIADTNNIFLTRIRPYYEYNLIPKNRLKYLIEDLTACESTEFPTYVKSFFSNYAGSNLQAYDTVNIADLCKHFGGSNSEVWSNYKRFYLRAKHRFYDETLKSLICFMEECSAQYFSSMSQGGSVYEASVYEVMTAFAGGGGLTAGCCFQPNCDPSGIYHNPGKDSISAVNYRGYSHFTGEKRLNRDLLDITNDSLLSDSVIILAKNGKYLAQSIYSLLKFYNLIDHINTISDSTNFVDNSDSLQLVCDPFNYISSNFSGMLKSDIYAANIASITNEYRKFYKDENNDLNFFICTNTHRANYNCTDFLTAHQAFITAFGSSAVPNIYTTAVNVNNSVQKKYANWMNHELGLNLGFYDYYEMAHNCGNDKAVSIFTDTIHYSFDSDTILFALRKAAYDLSNTTNKYLKEMSHTTLKNEIETKLTALSHPQASMFDKTNDYLGFGEPDYANSQNDLFYIAQFESSRENIATTFHQVMQHIKLSLDSLDDIESDTIAYAKKLNLPRYESISLTNFRFDRAYRYSNGTVWVRLLNTDTTYATDFYYHYEPYNGKYLMRDYETVNNEVIPVFTGKELHYIKLVNSTTTDTLLVSSATTLASTVRLGQVRLADYENEPQFPLKESCEDIKYETANINADYKYKKFIQTKIDTFKNEYSQYCQNLATDKAFTNQELNMTYTFSERQFTLYYYDKAGNLTMTVPPSGIDTSILIDTDSTAKIDSYRNSKGNTAELLPQHTKRTSYKYNSNNQVIRQVTPNSDTSYFWYDKAGRLALSQNANQQTENKYSYTFYDNQSRINEVGVVTLNELAGLSWDSIHAAIFLEIIGGVSLSYNTLIETKNRENVTKTFYDETVIDLSVIDLEQKNLRSRVATVANYLTYTFGQSDTDWEFAIHYSYDVTGNVDLLVNDYYQKGSISNNYHRYKTVQYEFDVISGNVTSVYYQLGRDDAFYHRYTYDAENRITAVKTSQDGIIWDEDATYEYYLHGPLARTELGNQQVQGIDYAYTLEGWLKTVNSGVSTADIGNDMDKNNTIAADAFGFALNYNSNDYQSVNDQNEFLIQSSSNTSMGQLYNGNISSINKHSQDKNIGTTYTYDQLNRLRGMREEAVDTTTLTWGSANGLADANSSAYSYDKSGNLLTLDRLDGTTGELMDKMSYNYISGTDKLESVNDTVEGSRFSNDIDNQVSGNYTYDNIGNLISDHSEDICAIRWYPNGKVKRVIRDKPTREKSNLYFEYDPMGNRIRKEVSFVEEGKLFRRVNYYARDAQGNVLANYEERDCDYYQANDSTGEYYYQYSEDYLYYTRNAILQSSALNHMNFLTTSAYARTADLCEEAYQNLNLITGIKDTIFEYLSIDDYFELYPNAKQRVLTEDPYSYANDLYNRDTAHFINLVNDRHEAYIQYLLNESLITTFYNDMDDGYSSTYGTSGSFSSFFQMNQNLITDYKSDTTKIKLWLTIGSADLAILQAVSSSQGAANDSLRSMLLSLEQELANSNNNSDTWTLIQRINAYLIYLDYGSDDMNSILSGIDFSHFYAALTGLTSPYEKLLSNVLYHISSINALYIDEAQLLPYSPFNSIDWLADSNGGLLKYLLNTQNASSTIYSAFTGFFANYNIKSSETFFDTPTTVYSYVENALIRHWTNTELEVSLLTLSNKTLDNLYLTEDLANLMNYFKEYHCDEVIRQNFHYDSLNLALTNMAHHTPIDYALSLEAGLSIDLGNLAGCNPHTIYMAPEQHLIYGSSRLGSADAKVVRKDSSRHYSRKLTAKTYELSDHLGNVVATVSDRKLHPQETQSYGTPSFDTTSGYQADITGRYDYFPFGMEIMGRSGDFNSIDYENNSYKLTYKGLLASCSEIIQTIPSGTSAICSELTTIYGDTFVNKLGLEYDDSTNAYYVISLRRPMADILPDVDTSISYRVEVDLEQVAGRNVTARFYYADGSYFTEKATSISAGEDASSVATREAWDKIVVGEFTGSEMADLTDLTLRLQFTVAGNAVGITHDVYITELRVFEVHNYDTVPLAKRNGSAYTYGFNGMERDDEVKGSGNSYDFGARLYDSRLGRWWSTDAYEKFYTPISPYVFAINSPIKLKDADGNVVVDENGKPVVISYSENEDGSFSATFKLEDGSDVSDEFMRNGGRAIQSAIQVQTGRDQVDKAIKSKDNIQIIITSVELKEEGSDGSVSNTLGKTFIPDLVLVPDETGEFVPSEVQNIKILISTKSIEKEIQKKYNAKESVRSLSVEQGIGSVLSHETEHATNELDREKLTRNEGLTEKEHKKAKNKGDAAGSEFREQNRKNKK